MAKSDTKLRSVNTHFWDDTYISELDPTAKLLFLYFLTNPLTNLIGVYEISLRRIAFDTGFEKDQLKALLDKFDSDNKIHHYNGFIILANFLKNQNFNANMQKGADSRINELPDLIKQFIVSKSLKGFESLSNHFKGSQILRKEEEEREGEVEKESEVEIEVENSISDHQSEIIKKLLNGFGFTEMNHPARQFEAGNLMAALEIQGKVDYFVSMLDAYFKYKQATGEIKHTWLRFLGSPDKKFTDGAWNAENWTHKLNSYINDRSNRKGTNGRSASLGQMGQSLIDEEKRLANSGHQ